MSVSRDDYAVYLVHWPVLVTFMVVNDRTDVGVVGGLGIVVLSLLLARALTWAVDRPVRAWRRGDSSPLVPVAVLAEAAGVVVLPVGAWQTTTWLHERGVEARAQVMNPGAAVLRDPALAEIPADATLLPLATLLDDEWVQLERECTGAWAVVSDELQNLH